MSSLISRKSRWSWLYFGISVEFCCIWLAY